MFRSNTSCLKVKKNVILLTETLMKSVPSIKIMKYGTRIKYSVQRCSNGKKTSSSHTPQYHLP